MSQEDSWYSVSESSCDSKDDQYYKQMKTASNKKIFKHKHKATIAKDNFNRFATNETSEKKPIKLIIRSDFVVKFYWDLLITILLMVICTVMPLHLAC